MALSQIRFTDNMELIKFLFDHAYRHEERIFSVGTGHLTEKLLFHYYCLAKLVPVWRTDVLLLKRISEGLDLQTSNFFADLQQEVCGGFCPFPVIVDGRNFAAEAAM